MGKFGGFGGFGGGNMQQLMKQAQKMQQDMAKAQEELKNSTVEAEAGGGMVKVVMSGDRRVNEIKIKKEAVDPDDIEMLEDLIIAALNEASGKVDELSEELMGPYAGMLG
ncbi:MAG: YbaB/EbfC family nucleoid-associated protein [Christensenellales bacterium]|jgi:DNA-binding YbaB/EbfC family protein